MKVIYKYNLSVTDTQDLEIDYKAKILDVQIQDGHLNLWALIDTNRGKGVKTIRIFGTGHGIAGNLQLTHLATVQDRGYVWHVFEEHGID